jgi:hypothetical protein
MATLRYQKLNSGKASLSIALQSYPFIKKITLKCGDALPNQKHNADKFYLSGIYNDDNNYETSYITIKNSQYEYKIPYKGNFEFVDNTIKEYDQSYDAHKFLDRKITLLKRFE